MVTGISTPETPVPSAQEAGRQRSKAAATNLAASLFEGYLGVKKSWLYVDVALVCLAVAAGCGGGASGTSTPSSAPTTSTAPQIAGLSVGFAAPFVPGFATQIPVAIIANDQAGKRLSGTYPAPITLTLVDGSGLTLSVSTVLSSTTPVTVAYDGRPLVSAPQIQAVSGAVSALAPASIDTDDPTEPATYTYSTTFVQNDLLGGGSPISSSETKQVTVSANASFNDVNGLFEIKSVTTGSRAASSTTTDDYVGFANASGSVQLVEYGLTFAELGLAETTTNAAPLVLDQFPATAGATFSAFVGNTTVLAFSSPDSPATDTRTVTHAPDGTSVTRFSFVDPPDASNAYLTTKADGSWTLITTATAMTPSVLSETGPINGFLTLTNQPGVPQPDPSVTPASTATPQITKVPSWFPGPGGTVPDPLSSAVTTDQGQVTPPAACMLPAKYAGPARALTTVRTQIEPFYGPFSRKRQRRTI